MTFWIALWQATLTTYSEALLLLCPVIVVILTTAMLIVMGLSAYRAPYDTDIWGQP